MYFEILSKLISESLLSLYPIFVKYINLNFWLQIWSRFFIYVFISGFFINWKFIFNNLFSKYGIALSLVTILHVYATYRGFLILESGIAYVIFYLYPLIILLLAGEKIGFIIISSIIGVIILSQEKIDNFQNIFSKSKNIENFKYEGIIMMIISAFTEAFIYFIVRNIKTTNNWNHVLIVEDDIQFLDPTLFIENLNHFLSSDIIWDVLLIAGNNVPPHTKCGDFCVKVSKCQTTTGYLVLNHYYDTFIENIKEGINLLIKNPNDHFFYAIDKYWLSLQEKHNWYLITPLSVIQREGYSDIENKNTNYSSLLLDLDKSHLFNKN
jgi:hypothetical protein